MMKKISIVIISSICLSFAITTTSYAASPGPQVSWFKKFTGENNSTAGSVAVGRYGEVYVGGSIFDSRASISSYRGIVMRYSPRGDLVWLRQLESPSWVLRLIVDRSGLFIYICGSTPINIDGNQIDGEEDIFLAKFDRQGNKLWTKQFGYPGFEFAADMAVDKVGNIYLAGGTDGSLPGNISQGNNDCCLIKTNRDGDVQWVRQFGTINSDYINGMSIGNDGTIMLSSGSVERDFSNGGETDRLMRGLIITRYDTYGNQLAQHYLDYYPNLWNTAQASDRAGNIYLLSGNSGQSGDSPCIIKLNPSGNLTSLLNTGLSWSTDIPYDLSIDPYDSIYLTGRTSRSFDGYTNAGKTDVFVVKFNSTGHRSWAIQYGTPDNDLPSGIALDWRGNAYVAGCIFNAVEDNTGLDIKSDAFLMMLGRINQFLFTHYTIYAPHHNNVRQDGN